MTLTRRNDSVLRSLEQRLIDWLCGRLPVWATSDMLTVLGVIGAAMAFCGFGLSHQGAGWLWLAIAGIALNWLGDSLDGSLARYLQAERPRYGFFLDHMSDTLAMALIGIGIGLSPHVHLTSGLIVLIAYYLMTILSLTICQATGIFRISFNGVGPTEIRLLIVACTLAVIMLPVPAFTWGEVTLTIYDAIMIALAGLMALTGAAQAIRTGRELSIADPPAHHP